MIEFKSLPWHISVNLTVINVLGHLLCNSFPKLAPMRSLVREQDLSESTIRSSEFFLSKLPHFVIGAHGADQPIVIIRSTARYARARISSGTSMTY